MQALDADHATFTSLRMHDQLGIEFSEGRGYYNVPGSRRDDSAIDPEVQQGYYR